MSGRAGWPAVAPAIAIGYRTAMERLFAFEHSTSSRIVLGTDAASRLPELVRAHDPDGVVIVHDETLAELASALGAELSAAATLAVAGGEAAKRLETVGELAERLHANGATRATVMVAIGGGTITDLCGFVASIYLRGVPFIACPTTTLAMCDAALGGKNGVDHCGLKNRLGTIRQPDAIVMDPAWLTTLPDEMFREGLVEVVKKAAVLDRERFEELERLAPALRDRDAEATERAIAMSVDMKMTVVLADEREGDRRRALNAGHTIGHAIESFAGGALRHGTAVAMGLVAECRAAGVTDTITERVAALLRAIGVDPDTPAAYTARDRLWELARQDKKAMRGSVPMHVPHRIGEGHDIELTRAMLDRAFATGRSRD